MKVLYLLRYYPTLTETFVYREIAAVAARGIEVTVASLGERADGALQEDLPDVPVLRVPRRPLTGRFSTPSAGVRFLRAHQRPKDAARLPWLVAHAAGFDRIHTHFAGEAAEFAHALYLDLGLPYSVTSHAADLFKPRPATARLLQAADAVLTVTEYNARLIEREFGVRARVVRSGIDPDEWPPRPLPDGPLRAIAVARNVPKKGLDTLLDAWAALDAPLARLTLVSDVSGPVPDGVRVLGLRPRAEVQAELAAANLFVLPCRRAPDGDMDGLPLALIEALASGRPVITTPISGIPELVDESVGWLVPPDDPQALVEALRAADSAERARRGARGPARIRELGCTLDVQARSVIAAWRGI